jgi:hypothetical protein
VPNLLEPGARATLVVSRAVDIAVPVRSHGAVKDSLARVRGLSRCAEEPSVWLPADPGLIEVNFIGMDPEKQAPGESYVLEDSQLPLLVFRHLSLLRPGAAVDLEGLTVPVPRVAGLLLEKLLTDRSGEKGDRDLLVALGLLLVCAPRDLEELEEAYRGLPDQERHAARSALAMLSLLEPRAGMPDPIPNRRAVADLTARLEGAEQRR